MLIKVSTIFRSLEIYLPVKILRSVGPGDNTNQLTPSCSDRQIWIGDFNRGENSESQLGGHSCWCSSFAVLAPILFFKYDLLFFSTNINNKQLCIILCKHILFPILCIAPNWRSDSSLLRASLTFILAAQWRETSVLLRPKQNYGSWWALVLPPASPPLWELPASPESPNSMRL